MSEKIEIPRYHQIAIEIASRIASGEYQIGDKIYARSSIASQFSVSPETARRAISVLSDLGIVQTEKGSGVTIISNDNAVEFIKQYNKRETIDILKANLYKAIQEQKEKMDNVNKHLSELVEATEHLRSNSPLTHFGLKIDDKCKFLGQTLAEIQFWQHTGSTIIAIRRGDVIIKSPGPYSSLQIGDTIYFISQDDTINQTKKYLYD